MEDKRSGLKNRIRIWAVAAAAAVLLFISGLLATALVHSAVFSRWDMEGTTSLPHSELRFKCGGDELTGELFDSKSDVLAVICPGFHAVQEDYEPLVRAFLEEGYSVFTFDPTGVGKSGGASQRCFTQIADDLAACLDFIEENGRFGATELIVLGHSRGGFAALLLADRADAVIAVGAPATAMDGVVSGAYAKIGGLAYANYPYLWLWRFGYARSHRAGSRR